MYTDVQTNSTTWYKDGVIHKEGEPAVVFTDSEIQWVEHGIFHRFEGPAIQFAGPSTPIVQLLDFSKGLWYIRGRHISEEKYAKFLNFHGMELTTLNDGDKAFIELNIKEILA